jgi:hypothetical protein
MSSSNYLTAVGLPSYNLTNPPLNILLGHKWTMCLIDCISSDSHSGESIIPQLWSK